MRFYYNGGLARDGSAIARGCLLQRQRLPQTCLADQTPRARGIQPIFQSVFVFPCNFKWTGDNLKIFCLFLLEGMEMNLHGEFKITVVGRCVEVKVKGAWNANTAKKYAQAFQASIEKLKDAPWGTIIDTTEWELGTPETEPVIAALQVWCMKNNQRYEATIVGESELKKYQADKYYEYLDSQAIDQRYFALKEDALDWFSELGLFEE